MLDEPRPVYYAGETAAPLFREVLNAVVTRFAIPSTEPMAPTLARKEKGSHGEMAGRTESVSTSQASALAGAPSLEKAERLELLGLGPDGKKTWKMPNLKGTTLVEALDSLAGAPLRMKAEGNGTVIEQSPAPGEKVREAELVHLKLAF